MSGPRIDPGFLRLLEDMDTFISGEISPPDFECRFFSNKNLHLQTLDGRKFGYAVYQALFYVVEDYVADPELRTDPEDLGDQDLLDAVVSARKKFTDELAGLGYDKYGRPRQESEQ